MLAHGPEADTGFTERQKTVNAETADMERQRRQERQWRRQWRMERRQCKDGKCGDSLMVANCSGSLGAYITLGGVRCITLQQT